MKSKFKSQFSFALSILFIATISSTSFAQADFTGDFAPANWIYYENNTTSNGPRNALSVSTMQLDSADWNSITSRGTYGQYGIEIPWYLESIKFDYSYVTYDVDGSSFDMPSYTLNGQKSYLVADNIPKNGTATGSISLDVSALAGKPLFFTQECSDCILGAATIKITNFTAKSRSTLLNSNTLSINSSPILVRVGDTFVCKSPTFAFKRYGYSNESAAPTALVYSLSLDGRKVSSVSSDNWKSLARFNFDSTKDTIEGSATYTSASWTVAGKIFTSAQCEVVAFQESATSLSFSNIVGN